MRALMLSLSLAVALSGCGGRVPVSTLLRLAPGAACALCHTLRPHPDPEPCPPPVVVVESEPEPVELQEPDPEPDPAHLEVTNPEPNPDEGV